MKDSIIVNGQKITKGTTIRILEMDGEPEYFRRVGIVDHIDDADQIHGTWGGCALIPNVDNFEIIDRIDISDITNEYSDELIFEYNNKFYIIYELKSLISQNLTTDMGAIYRIDITSDEPGSELTHITYMWGVCSVYDKDMLIEDAIRLIKSKGE